MKKLNKKKIRWIIREMEKGEMSVYKIAKIQKITPRHARRIYKTYLDTEEYPYPKPSGRKPKRITEEEKYIVSEIRKVHPLCAVLLEKLLDDKEIHLPHNRIHKILKNLNLAKNEPKKQKRRKYIRYERRHSNSLWHTDYAEDKSENKHFIPYEDDASRFIVGYGLFQNATAENSSKTLSEAVNRYIKPKQVMSDHGVQFTTNERNGCPNPKPNEFEKKLIELGIQQVLARVNHPQSNGKVERFIQTIRKLKNHFGSYEMALHYYNFKRPHMSLNLDICETPFQAYIRKMPPVIRSRFIQENIELVTKYAPQYLPDTGKKSK